MSGGWDSASATARCASDSPRLTRRRGRPAGDVPGRDRVERRERVSGRHAPAPARPRTPSRTSARPASRPRAASSAPSVRHPERERRVRGRQLVPPRPYHGPPRTERPGLAPIALGRKSGLGCLSSWSSRQGRTRSVAAVPVLQGTQEIVRRGAIRHQPPRATLSREREGDRTHP